MGEITNNQQRWNQNNNNEMIQQYGMTRKTDSLLGQLKLYFIVYDNGDNEKISFRQLD